MLPTNDSLERDHSSVDTGPDLTSGTRPTPGLTFHHFDDHFWDTAHFSSQALPDNRLGRLAEEQRHLMRELFQRPGTWLLIVAGVLIQMLIVSATINKPSLVGSIFVAFFVLSAVIGLTWHLAGLWRDSRSGRVDSLCGELTKWEDDGRHVLKHRSLSVDLSSEAYKALPARAHYRIYFTPNTRKVVNVDTHSSDAPHEVGSRRSADQR
jgi:hypothetical protein